MSDDIYKAPESELQDEVTEDNELGSRWARLFASLIDGLTIIPISLVILYFTGGLEGITSGAQTSLMYTLMIFAVTTTIFLIIHGAIIIRDGQTWGKKATKIKIVTINGAHADIPTLAKRYGFYWVLPNIPIVGQLINLINILFIFSSTKQCLHDRVAGTKVVKAK